MQHPRQQLLAAAGAGQVCVLINLSIQTETAQCTAQHSLTMDDGVHRLNGSLNGREWLGGPEATSTGGKDLTGKAFATGVRPITDHLNDKISHISIESRNIVMRWPVQRRDSAA
jgi:hypothetical protein